MGFIENIGVGQERAKAGHGAKIDRPAAMLCAREKGGIGIAENPPAEGDEARVFFGGNY
jgi:hypothetical protein